MHGLLIVAANTLRESLRDKILYNLVFFALILIGASVLIGALTIAEQDKIIKDMGLAAINLTSVAIAIFVGVGLVTKEIERRTIYTILARPITRAQFVFGKYIGLSLTILINVGIMVAIFVATLWLSNSAIHGSLFQAIQLLLIEALLVTAIAMFFSTFTSPTLGATMTIGLYVIGHLTADLKALAEKNQNEITKAVMTVLYYLCPNLEMLNIKGQAAHGVLVSASYQMLATTYGLFYAGVLLLGAFLIFERRDF